MSSKHTVDKSTKGWTQEKFRKVLRGLSYKLRLHMLLRNTFSGLLLLWVLCFAYHFYLYSLFVKWNLISMEWTFGQIIAIIVWVPSFVEYFYIAHGKFTGRSLSPAAYGANKSIFRGHRGRLKIQIPPRRAGAHRQCFLFGRQ